VGFGAPVPTATKQFDGKIVIMSADDFAVVHEARDSQKHITELKCAQRGPQFLRYHNQRVCRSIRDCFSGTGGGGPPRVGLQRCHFKVRAWW
jgi:hypothetical protein